MLVFKTIFFIYLLSGHTEKNAAPLHIVYRLSATTQRTFAMLRAKAAKAQASLHTMNNEKVEIYFLVSSHVVYFFICVVVAVDSSLKSITSALFL